ncbi:hypothetical protein [Petrimonas sp.]|uniref:hypothetical protein n=1 Tax=Petrimonas sp. TaxID=2023866 RepID=UPI003F50FA2F
MKYKIGDKFNVIIPGFSPTVANIDNIREKDGEFVYCISFQEERLFTLCREITEMVLDEIIDTYNKNKDNLDSFMVMAGKDDGDELKQPELNNKKYRGDIVDEAQNITEENEVDFTMEAEIVNSINENSDG